MRTKIGHADGIYQAWAYLRDRRGNSDELHRLEQAAQVEMLFPEVKSRERIVAWRKRYAAVYRGMK